MPKSKRRKKDGKPVGNGAAKREAALDNMESGVSLQDLINVVAYQEYVKDGTIVAPDVKVDIPDEIPVTVGEGEDKRQVGTAFPVSGSDNKLSIRIEEQRLLEEMQDPAENYSLPTVNDIDFEDPDTQAVIRAVAETSKYKNEEN